MAKTKNKNKLNICLASSELTPLAKTGGLADVNAALSAYLNDAGHDVRALIPFYASMARNGLKIEPVADLQNLPISIGSHHFMYSIDKTTLPASKLPVFLLRCPALYERPGIYTEDADEHLRFILLSRVAIEMCQRMQFSPDIFHCHDWHTSLIPLFLRTLYAWDKLFRGTRSVLTIHNIGYQGVFSGDILDDLELDENQYLLHQGDLLADRINFLKTGVLYADMLTTVSPSYAEEIKSPEYGWGLDDILRDRSDGLVGILNGVDYTEWNPKTDPLIPQTYSSKDLEGKEFCKQVLMNEMGLAGGPGQPLIGIVSRLVEQKGVDLMERVLPTLLARRNFSLAVLGSGEARFERFFETLQKSSRGRVSFYRGYNNKLAHWIEAGSDMFLMPSNYEPCGLNQMYSLRYGTIPIVRETGGLADSVEQVDEKKKSGTGILFRDYDETGLAWGISRALELYENKPLWKKIMLNGMAKDFSWSQQGEEYVALFRQLVGK